MRLALVLLCLATPLRADPCGDHFTAGMLAAQPVETWLTETEHLLYSGLGWVTRGAVMQRLEDRRAETSACQELNVLGNELSLVERRIAQADRSFRLAQAFCWSVNRDRAERNLGALEDSLRMAGDLRLYLNTLREQCR